MMSIFSTQNLQTFFLRKYCRLPRGRPPGPPGPPSRRPPPPPCPPSRRPPPPPCPPPPSRASRGAGAGADEAAACTGLCSSDIRSYLSHVLRAFPERSYL